MNKISNEFGTLGGLVSGSIPELQAEVFSYLDPADLTRVARVNQGTKVGVNLPWERIVKTLGYRGNPKESGFKSYRKFLDVLVNPIVTPFEFEQYPKDHVPQDIREIVNRFGQKKVLSVKEVMLLQDYMRARDTLVVWKAIAKQAGNIQIDFGSAFCSGKQVIERAKGFKEWLNKNQKLLVFNELDLSYKQLTSIPKEVGNLTNLTELSLSDNHLTSIPKEVENLQSLQTLEVSHNKLTQIPKEVGNLTNLKNLELACNRLTSIPKELGNLTNLDYLTLCYNELTSIPEELGNLRKLRYLYLSVNQLTKIPTELGNLQDLTRLRLCSNNLTSIPKKFGDLKNLLELSITGNRLASIPVELGKMQSLQELNLRGNQLSSFPEGLYNLQNLILLDLSSNPFTLTPNDLRNLQNLMRTNIRTLQLTPSTIVWDEMEKLDSGECLLVLSQEMFKETESGDLEKASPKTEPAENNDTKIDNPTPQFRRDLEPGRCQLF